MLRQAADTIFRGRPFAVLIGIHDAFCSLDQIVDALLGGEQVAVATGRVSRRGDGFYGRSQQFPNGKNRRVSCVFALQDWMPGLSGRDCFDSTTHSVKWNSRPRFFPLTCA